MADIAAAQHLLVGLVLAAAGLTKLLRRGMDAPIFAPLLKRPAARAAATAAVAALELALAAALLAGVGARHAAVGAAAFLFAAAIYVTVLLARGIRVGCGCFGGRDNLPMVPLTAIRAAVLAAAAAAAAAGASTWWEADPAFVAGLVGVELLVLVALSPELWALRTARIRRRCTTTVLSYEAALEVLRSSRAWGRVRRGIASERPADRWREGCWRFFAFPRREAGLIVLAVRLVDAHPRIRVSTVPPPTRSSTA